MEDSYDAQSLDFIDDDELHHDMLDFQECDYNLEDDVIDDFICSGSSLSFHEFAVLIMTLKTVFNLPCIALSFILKIMKSAMPPSNRVPSLSKLYEYFQGKDDLLKKHFYCSNCDNYIEDIQNFTECGKCNNKETQFFVEIPLKEELKSILESMYFMPY